MQVEPFKLEEVTLLTPGAPITILGIAGQIGQIRHFYLQIDNLLTKWVQEQVKQSKIKPDQIFKPPSFYKY
jgi:hypothetical protein